LSKFEVFQTNDSDAINFMDYFRRSFGFGVVSLLSEKEIVTS